ncbi:MAG: creatininase family protein [Gemmatimonadaceae bacterium]
MSLPRPWMLGESRWPTVRAIRYDTAILPWGATEAHNTHLPYATDTIESTWIAEESARRAWNLGARCAVLPTMPFGVQTGQRDIPFCINMNPSTQAALLRDVALSLEPHDVRSLLILNGHGGNDFRQMIRELQPATSLFLCAVNWYTCVPAAEYFQIPGDHAGELETSVVQHIAPHLVAPLAEAGDGQAKAPRIQAFREGWAWAPRPWTKVTQDTGVGDPKFASAEKGARYLEAVCDRLASLFVELSAIDPREMFD